MSGKEFVESWSKRNFRNLRETNNLTTARGYGKATAELSWPWLPKGTLGPSKGSDRVHISTITRFTLSKWMPTTANWHLESVDNQIMHSRLNSWIYVVVSPGKRHCSDIKCDVCIDASCVVQMKSWSALICHIWKFTILRQSYMSKSIKETLLYNVQILGLQRLSEQMYHYWKHAIRHVRFTTNVKWNCSRVINAFHLIAYSSNQNIYCQSLRKGKLL